MKTKILNTISMIALIIPLLVFFFGNNILDKIKVPSLTYSLNSMSIKETDYYKEIRKIGQEIKVPDEIWEITITNRGKKASTNVNISIQYIGSAFEVIATSLENSQIKMRGNSELQLSMSRMSNNSTLAIKLLFENKPSDLKIQYTDDFGSRIAMKDMYENDNNIKIISISILFIIIILILLLRVIIPEKKKYIALTKDNEILEKEKQSIIDQNDDLKAQIELIETNQNSIDPVFIASMLYLNSKKKK